LFAIDQHPDLLCDNVGDGYDRFARG
jgi:hypothetical protein